MAHGHADTAENNEKRERNARIVERYDQLNREGKHGHYETMFCIVREEVERERDRCARIAEAQPPFPDTKVGMRQQWVKNQIASSIRTPGWP